MVLVYLKNDDCVEVEAAQSAEVRGAELVCLDAAGRVVARFPSADVQIFTANEPLAEVVKEEVCDDDATGVPGA